MDLKELKAAKEAIDSQPPPYPRYYFMQQMIIRIKSPDSPPEYEGVDGEWHVIEVDQGRRGQK